MCILAVLGLRLWHGLALRRWGHPEVTSTDPIRHTEAAASCAAAASCFTCSRVRLPLTTATYGNPLQLVLPPVTVIVVHMPVM